MEDVPTTILSAHRCHLGEGAAFDPSSGTAWWFDILEKKLFEARIPDGDVVVHSLPFMASQISFVDERTQLLFAEDGLHVRNARTGRLTLHTPVEADNTATRSNDGRVHPSGALWCGTMGKAGEAEAGSIYWFFAGELRRLYARITTPNAICFSADGRTGYFTDTRKAVIQRVALDPANGLPVGEPADFYDSRGEEGGPDGAVIDAEGRLWNARWGGGRIDCHAPDGARLRSIRVPARQPSCPAFVGPGLDRMLLTTAWDGMDEAAKAADPGHGRTFLLDVGARGRPEPRVTLSAG